MIDIIMVWNILKVGKRKYFAKEQFFIIEYASVILGINTSLEIVYKFGSRIFADRLKKKKLFLAKSH